MYRRKHKLQTLDEVPYFERGVLDCFQVKLPPLISRLLSCTSPGRYFDNARRFSGMKVPLAIEAMALGLPPRVQLLLFIRAAW
jgi:hypothetical protein